MREIETQPVGRDQRAFLRDTGAENFAQRRMQQVSRRMIEHGRAAHRRVDLGRHLVADAHLPEIDDTEVQVCRTAFPGVRDPEYSAARQSNDALVADLAAALRVKRRSVEHERARFTLGESIDEFVTADDRAHRAGLVEPVVADEFGDDIELQAAGQVDVERAFFLRSLALFRQRLLIALLIDLDAARACDVRRHVGGKTIRIVELERDVAGEHAVPNVGERRLENTHAAAQRAGELLFLFQ